MISEPLVDLQRLSPLAIDQPIKLEAKGVNFHYGANQALFGIDLAFRANSVTALIGPSGCGKSTFLRTLNRLNDEIEGTRVEGDVLLEGRSIYGRGVDVSSLRRRVGIVSQRPNPFAKSIFDNVAYAPRLVGKRDRKTLQEVVERSLRQAALWEEVKDTLHKSALDLSGGQQQRLCIARSLAAQPEVILMDEPCSALDPISTAQIEELLGQMKKEYTIVIVTHNLQQAFRVSDQAAFFYQGRLIEASDSEKMFSRPAHQQTEDYIRGRFG